jgi:hypothetical protein
MRSSIQQFFHNLPEFAQAEGFVNEARNSQFRGSGEGLFSGRGHGDNFGVREILPEFLYGFESVLFGHTDVGDYEIGRVFAEKLQTELTVIGLFDLVAGHLKHGANRDSYAFFVVNDQYTRQLRPPSL